MARLKKRKDGRYRKDVYIGRNEDGKKRYKAVFGTTIKEVEQKAHELKVKLNKGYNLDLSKDTFGDWAKRWLEMKKNEISYKRYTSYRGAIKHLEPIFNNELCEIKTFQIQAIIYSLAEGYPPLAKATLNNIKIAASQIFDFAINNRVLDYNPTKAVKIPKSAKKTIRRTLTEEEQKYFIDTPHRGQIAAMLAMYSGLRRGEVIPLMWSDIDIYKGTIRVDKSVEEINNKFVVKSGAKTKSGTRTVYIPKTLVKYLSKMKRNSIYVCPNSKGGFMTPSAWDRMWENYVNTLKLKYEDNRKETNCVSLPNNALSDITLHTLRHTFATLLYLAGVDVLTAKEQLGHNSIQTTLDIYTHLDGLHKKKTINKLDEYIDKIDNKMIN